MNKSKILEMAIMNIQHRFEAEGKGTTRIGIELVASPNYNAHGLIGQNWADLFPDDVIVKCSHCGQYAARKTECVHCGAPVD